MKRYSTVLWVVILCCVSNALLLAEIPRSLSVQGILSNSAYDIDKVYIIKTSLYSEKSDANVLFTQFDTLHIEKNGLFAIHAYATTIRAICNYLREGIREFC
jgi:hypothetical protein